MDSKYTSIEKAFYSDGFKLGMKALESANREKAILDSIAEMYNIIDNLIESLAGFAQKQNKSIDCKKGCFWCCHQPVFALDYELTYLKKHITENFSKEKQIEIQKRAKQKVNKLNGIKNEELLNSKHPCPLLENSECSAYKARPMACRIYLSTNLKSCVRFFENPEDKSNFPNLLDFPMRAGRLMNEGFKAALKSKGYIINEFRIEEKLSF